MGFADYANKCWCFLMGRPTNFEKKFRARCKDDPIDLGALLSRWRPCPAEAHKHRNYQRDCSQCHGVNCKRMAELGLNDGAEPLPKSERPECGAKTRAGGQCQARVVPGKRRCRLHGGLSTGPKVKRRVKPNL
ncbi:HGGxSTG domain-containing protein [Ruegeria sp. HKCCA4008]|uniref:HGGxSTG domain-containing protein n=1 Tax=Ruegeria sp. HKCCA4008 TaxID=2682999 RepID=UPI0035301ADA